MMILILLLLALLCFLLAAVNSRTLFNLNLSAAGLFFATLAYLLQSGILSGLH